MKLNIELFERLNGTSPIKEFIDELPEKAQAKVLRTLELLEEYGPEMGMPHVKSLSGIRGAWEVRVKFNTNIYRFPFIINRGTAVILHAFIKKTQKISEKDLKIIKKRLREI